MQKMLKNMKDKIFIPVHPATFPKFLMSLSFSALPQIRICMLINCQEWRRKQQSPGFRDNKGFVWRRWNPDNIPHQRPPRPKLVINFASDSKTPDEGECSHPSELQDISSQSFPFLDSLKDPLAPPEVTQDSSQSLSKSMTEDDNIHNGIIVPR